MFVADFTRTDLTYIKSVFLTYFHMLANLYIASGDDEETHLMSKLKVSRGP